MVLTLLLIACLGAVFLQGFREAIGIAVFIVALYLALNAVVLGVCLYQLSSTTRSLSRTGGQPLHAATATR